MLNYGWQNSSEAAKAAKESLANCHWLKSPKEPNSPCTTPNKHQNKRAIFVALLANVSFFVANFSCQPPSESPTKGDLAVINGAPGNAWYHNAVGALLGVYEGFIIDRCSAVLITHNTILTAGHCVEKMSNSKETVGEAYTGKVFFGDDITKPEGAIVATVNRMIIHPDYTNTLSSTESTSGNVTNDIAIVSLTEAIPSDKISPVPILPQALQMSADDTGHLINFAGFGLTNSNGIDSGLKRRQIDRTLAGFGCPPEEFASCVGDPSDPSREFTVSLVGGGPCIGDSGGPGLVSRLAPQDMQPHTYVAGIQSRVDSKACQELAISTRVSAYQAWIETTVNELAEPEPLP